MNPVVKRILVHGGATAFILAVVGFVFTELAGIWLNSPGRTGPAEANPSVSESLRYRVPLMMAFWGFVFVAVTELVLSRLRGPVPVKAATAPPPDDAEKLLNELLAQAEAKMAAEAASKAEGQMPMEGEKKPEAEQSRPSAG
jgi:hypothetical protein